MEPRLLLQWLLDRDGDNSNSLAVALKNAVTQPQIHKYLSGKARQPRHSTLEPIAKHYGIPIDALYNEGEADRVMELLKSNAQTKTSQPTSLSNQPEQPSSREVCTLEQSLEGLAAYLASLDESDRQDAMKMLSALADRPDKHVKVAAAIKAMVGAPFANQDRRAA